MDYFWLVLVVGLTIFVIPSVRAMFYKIVNSVDKYIADEPVNKN